MSFRHSSLAPTRRLSSREETPCWRVCSSIGRRCGCCCGWDGDDWPNTVVGLCDGLHREGGGRMMWVGDADGFLDGSVGRRLKVSLILHAKVMMN